MVKVVAPLVFHFVVGLALVRASPKIKGGGWLLLRIPHPKLSNKAHLVARLLQQHGVGTLKSLRAKTRGKILNLVPGHVLPAQQAGPAHAADGGRDVGVLKQDPTLGQTVQMGRFDNWISHRAQGVPAVIVGEQENDVGRRSGLRLGRLHETAGYQPRTQKYPGG